MRGLCCRSRVLFLIDTFSTLRQKETIVVCFMCLMFSGEKINCRMCVRVGGGIIVSYRKDKNQSCIQSCVAHTQNKPQHNNADLELKPLVTGGM